MLAILCESFIYMPLINWHKLVQCFGTFVKLLTFYQGNVIFISGIEIKDVD